MAESLYSNALTTQTRVKNRLVITDTGFDTLLLRLINSVTDWIEGECNKKFLRQTYTNEVYAVHERGMSYLPLKQAPVVSISAFEYRAGTPGTPSWTALTTDEYELLEDGKSGLVRVYNSVPYGVNAVRVTYIAGYLIDFANAPSATHTLPADLTELAERMVVRAFRRRDSSGKTTESFNGNSIAWSTDLDPEEKAILDRYRRLPAFV